MEILNIPFPNLFDELLDYSKNQKVKYIYLKCLNNKKYELAQKIANKYKIKPYRSDLAMA